MMTDADPNDFTVKEILVEMILPRLDELDKKVDVKAKESDDKFAAMEAFRSKAIGAMALFTCVLIPLAVPVVSALLASLHG